MSFSTYLEVQCIGRDIQLSEIKETIETLLDADDIHRDVFADLETAFGGIETIFNVHAFYLLTLIERIAALLPTSEFHARGRGEELREIWVREFSNGEVVFALDGFE